MLRPRVKHTFRLILELESAAAAESCPMQQDESVVRLALIFRGFSPGNVNEVVIYLQQC